VRNFFLKCGFLIVIFVSPFLSQAQIIAAESQPISQHFVDVEAGGPKSTLREERESLERQADRQFNHLCSLVNVAMWALGVIAAAFIGLSVFFWGRTKKDIESSVKELFEKEARELIHENADQLRNYVSEIKHQVDDVNSYKDSSILWIFTGEQIGNEREVEELYSSGLKNIYTLTPALGADFAIGEPDLVIFSYTNTDESRRIMASIVDQIKTYKSPIHFIIYTFRPDAEQRLSDADFQSLQGYTWFIIANLPSSLIAYVKALLANRRTRKP